jgi:hypothetical protein
LKARSYRPQSRSYERGRIGSFNFQRSTFNRRDGGLLQIGIDPRSPIPLVEAFAMKLFPDSWLNGARVPLSLVGVALLGADARLSAQEPADGPVRNAIKFTMHISGTGNDPAPVGNNSGVLESSQSWTYDRTLDGWFEVDVTRRKEGTGDDVRQVIEYSHKKGQRHEIIGTVADRADNFERSGAEDFNSVYVDYRAKETTDWTREIASLPSNIGVVLDATNKQWLVILEPHFLIGDYFPTADFQALAHYKPSSPGGFGEPWDYAASDPSLLLAGDRKQILLRYHPGGSGFGILNSAPEQQNVEAKYRGTVATGHAEFEVPRPDGAKGTWTMKYVVDWEARSELPDVELEVLCPKYAKWRPQATDESASPGAGRTSGPGLDFSAKLRRTDGNKKAKLPKIESMEWRLSGTSREPGIAMNFPYKSDDKRPDMEIVASDLTSPEDDTAQAVVIRAAAGETMTAATVIPFDWGGWTTLRVTAKLDDGRTIVGRLKGWSEAAGPLENIPVPASHPGSHIALSWVQEKCPGWHSDAADEDKFPAGRPGVDGDGFSVYEEYRGFYLYRPRTHVSTEPAKKDLFVFNNAGFRGGVGLAHFWSLSKLAVRILLPGDLPRAEENERTVNCNIGGGATNGPQTAIYLKTTRSLKRLNDEIPSNSRPGTVPAILVPGDNAQLGDLSSGLNAAAYLNQTEELDAVLDHMVMQALFQTVGVDRPGPSGTLMRRVFVPAAESADGKPYYKLDGERVVIEREVDGFDFAVREQRMWDPPPNGEGSTVRYVLVGTKGSAHSGPENCVMRDWFADYYLSRETRDGFPLYRMGPLEKPGTRLGTTRTGTGINLKTRRPEPAYGDSNVAQPANKQLVVRDNAP